LYIITFKFFDSNREERRILSQIYTVQHILQHGLMNKCVLFEKVEFPFTPELKPKEKNITSTQSLMSPFHLEFTLSKMPGLDPLWSQINSVRTSFLLNTF
jgi:hypothetical protein